LPAPDAAGTAPSASPVAEGRASTVARTSIVKRLLTAAVGIPILYFSIKSGPVWLTFALVGGCAALAAWEACGLLTTPQRRPLTPIAMAGSVLLPAPFLVPGLPLALPLLLVLAATLVASTALRHELVEQVEASLATIFVVVFVGFPLGFLTALRATPDEEMGRDLLVLLLVVVWLGDTAAMYVGSMIGRHRLAPRISPHKSVEGAVAGVVAGSLAGLVAHFWWFHRLPIGHALTIGALVGLAGIGGDLAESVLKRAAGAKDSSSLLPGHGGFLDRIDSLLFAGPVLYYYYQALIR
jgi:phosphatidate cytidylyltransferase